MNDVEDDGTSAEDGGLCWSYGDDGDSGAAGFEGDNVLVVFELADDEGVECAPG